MRKSLADNICDLHTHSTYSIQDGFGSPEDIVLRAKELGQSAACLTEHGHMCSAPFFYQACRAHGIKPIIGVEFYVVPDQILGVNEKEHRSASRHLTVLALSKEGYQNLVKWVSFSHLRENFYGKPRISLDAMAELAPHSLRHNVILSGCLGSEINQTLLSQNGHALDAGLAYIESIKTLFPNFFIELQGHRHPKFHERGFASYDGVVEAQDSVRSTLLSLADLTNTPVVLTNDSHYQSSEQRRAHMALLVGKRWRKQDDEVHQASTVEQQILGFARDYIYYQSYLQPMEDIAERLELGQESVDNIRAIVAEADIRLEPLDGGSGVSIPFSGYEDPVEEIRRRSKARLKRLVAKHGQEVKERFEFELEVMADFGHYLMLTANILRDSHEAGILTWTRGSAANSLVCYCLKIHDIDPIEFKLPFERFMNPTRKELPDIDIDVQSSRREDFIKIMNEQMEQFEGPDQTLAVCTYGTLANRSAFKLAAEALGMTKERADELSQLLPQMVDSGFIGDENDVYSALKDEYPELASLASKTFKQVKSYGQHACAYVLGTKAKRLTDWVPSMLIASSNAKVSQYDMDALKEFGLVKMDALRLDSLDIIANILRMAGRSPFDLYSISLDDPKTYKLLCAGRTEGIHSMQGKTQRRGCMEIRPENIHDVVAIQALYRAGGTRSGMDKSFVKRRRGEEEFQVPELIDEILEETYGYPLFQEQILQIGQLMGATNQENQELLRAIKRASDPSLGKSEFARLKSVYEKYATKVLSQEEFDEFWNLTETASGYMFNRGHASSYAVLAVRMAYLRANYPQEFFSALLDAYPQNAQFLSAAQDTGFSFLLPDVNESGAGFSRGNTKHTIRVGLSRIRGVGVGAANALLRSQPFHSVADVRERTPTNVVKTPQIEALRSVGAFEQFGVCGDDDDFIQFKYLGFCLSTPRVFAGIEPTLPARSSGQWKFKGLVGGTSLTEGKSFCAKLFWIPPLDEKELLKLKASPWALVKSYLLTAVDINGIPFELSATEKKESESKMLRLLAKYGRGAVVCVEGQLKGPFQRGHPNMFTCWGISNGDSNAHYEEPLIWYAEDDRLLEWIAALTRDKKVRRAA